MAVIYTLKRGGDGKLEGPLNKRILATFGGKRALFGMALREAKQRGLDEKAVYFLADGDLALWALQKEFFPTATPCVDWYHVCEYLWSAGTAVFDEGSPELASWVHDRKTELLTGKVDAVFDALAALRPKIGKSGPGTKGRRDRLARTETFLKNHRAWLNYAQLESADMDIATGAVEGAINYVIGRRLDGSMVRWSPSRADNVLALGASSTTRDGTRSPAPSKSCTHDDAPWRFPDSHLNTPECRMMPFGRLHDAIRTGWDLHPNDL